MDDKHGTWVDAGMGRGSEPQFPAWCRHRVAGWVGLIGVLAVGTGCSPSRFLARRILQAPNTYATWFAPTPFVTYGLPEAVVTNFPSEYLKVGPPEATLHYRVVEPGTYHLRFSGTNWVADGRTNYQFQFSAPVTEAKPLAPCGTILLLHGYSVDLDTLVPWGVRLGGEGWRSVLVDLRGHGDSTGRQVYFGTVETHDLRQLLDELERNHRVTPPVVVVGASYGAALGLKLATEDERVRAVVAITPYARFERAVWGIRQGYASWIPESWTQGALEELPRMLGVAPKELDPIEWLGRHPVRTLLIGGTGDTIAEPNGVMELTSKAAPGSAYLEVAKGVHETIPFQLNDLEEPVVRWLNTVR